MRAHLGRRGERRSSFKSLEGRSSKALPVDDDDSDGRPISRSLALSRTTNHARPVVLELLPDIASFSLESMPDEEPSRPWDRRQSDKKSMKVQSAGTRGEGAKRY